MVWNSWDTGAHEIPKRWAPMKSNHSTLFDQQNILVLQASKYMYYIHVFFFKYFNAPLEITDIQCKNLSIWNKTGVWFINSYVHGALSVYDCMEDRFSYNVPPVPKVVWKIFRLQCKFQLRPEREREREIKHYKLLQRNISTNKKEISQAVGHSKVFLVFFIPR